eukprot:UN12883
MIGYGGYGQLGTGDTKKRLISTKMQYLREQRIVDVSLGFCHSSVIKKQIYKDDEKEKNSKCFILKYDEAVNITNKGESYQIYMKNSDLFGNDDWFQIQSVSLRHFADCSSIFIDSLQMNENKIISIDAATNIDGKYHSQIINAQYILRINEKNEEINEIKHSDKLYEFEGVKNLKDIK